MTTPYQAIIDALLACDQDQVTTLVQKALDDGADANQILNQGLIAGMDIVGERMESGDMFIPEVLMAAQAMSAAVEILKPLLTEDDASAKGRVVIGTVKGDLHDIGKNLVAMMMESAGLEVSDLGVDVAPEKFLAAIEEKNANILCMSALLTTTMPMMHQTIQAVADKGLRDRIKIMVGGAPVSQAYAREIQADAWAPDAGAAAKTAKALLQ
ncbi:MAG: corrinoid protein [Deltaproteobacteria bacterium]|nr:corrinoid protein [Deltaproteobacteria bacterium]